MTPISDRVPEDFAHACGELVELVGQISRIGVPNEVPKGPEEISQEVLDEKVDEWKHGDCRGAVTLAEAAIKALQYELLRLRSARPKARGFRMGELQIIFEPGEAQGPPHGHLSVSHPSRYPTYEELSWAARAPGEPPPNLWMWLPKPEKAQRMHRYTVHLYVLPPEELLG